MLLGVFEQWRWAAWLTVLLLLDSASGFFEKQPKLITESGNLIIESANDANITIRLRGRGAFKVNDISLSEFIDRSASNGSSLASGAQFSQLEANVHDLSSAVADLRSNVDVRHRLQARLLRLERRTNNTSNTWFSLRRRLNELDRRLTARIDALERDNCASTPCSNGGSCHNELGSFRCTCPSNYEGATCASDRNECAAFAGTDLGCQNGATCVNTVGAYQCECAAGWKGTHCTRRTVDCLAGGAGDLCGHGACVQTTDARGYRCVCEQGWKTDGVSPACTVDVDECREDRPHCSMDPPVQCVNLPGSFMCGQCPVGYEGNGYWCRDVDECAVNNGGCSTMPSVRCINTRGSHHCAPCPTGWQGDGRTCTVIDANDGSAILDPSGTTNSAASCPPGLCHPLAVCRPRNTGTTRCECPPGTIGTGYGPRGCRLAIDDPMAGVSRCSRYLCLNGGTCDESSGTPVCRCPAGYAPPLCMPISGCSSSPCRNGGTCQPLGSGFRCRCPATHRGVICEAEARQCGGVLTAASGVLAFPVVSGGLVQQGTSLYSHNQRCAWLIQTNVTQVLNVTFTQFSLEPSVECRFDWLQIHDGASSSAHLIGRFCGQALPLGGQLLSTHNALYLWFRSDNSTARDGFRLEWQSVAPQCGGRIEVETFGVIRSPGSPGNYPQNRDCEWLLVAQPGKRIELHFFGMQLERHADCSADTVTVYDGTRADGTDGTVLAQFCNTTHPAPLTSSAGELLVRFHSDGVGADAGFQIHYSVTEGVPGCGGTWTDASGEITSPLRDGRYKANLMCEYVIRQPADSRVRVRFERFQLEHSADCVFDYVAMHEGATREAPLVGRWCGTQMPPVHLSLTNVLTIVMRTDYSIGGEGFRLTYEMVCGRTYTAENGTITSPLYPAPYARNSRCAFEIVAPPGKAIVLDFEDFDMEDTDPEGCSFDYVAVFDGHVAGGDAVAQEPQQRFCAASKPPQQISTTNVMTVVLRTDSSLQGRGFKANYSWTEAGCGGVIKTLGHMIKPPIGEGATYAPNSNCTWLLVAPPGKVVQLRFSSFDLEDSSGECWFDYVMMRDGDAETGNRMGKYCGAELPPAERSMGNVMAVQFVSDHSHQGNGFEATYEFLDGSQFCGGRLFSPTGSINSPGWPTSNYPPNQDCTWTIIAPVGQQIEVMVSELAMERHHGSCMQAYDYIEFRHGDSENSTLLDRYCDSNMPKTIRSHANKLWIRFVSDSSVGAKGFRMSYDSTLSGCGGHLRGIDRGSLTSPNYPTPYDRHMTCEWRISVSLGSTVQLDFSDLDLEQQSNCLFDAVEIFDGRNGAAHLLGRFCGSSIPPTINTTTNEVYIRMVSDVSNNGRGFDLRFRANCVQHLTSLHGVIQSPNNPNEYPAYANCKWTIAAPRGNRIQLTFSEFKLETAHFYQWQFETAVPIRNSDACVFDYLAIDQLDASGTAVDSHKYCREMPGQLLSFTDRVELRFHSDQSVGETGFRVEYSIVGCGELRRAQPNGVGELQSPNYPSAPANAASDCSWDIEAPYGNVIELTLHDYDFPQSDNCSRQGVAIASAANVTLALAGRNSTAHAFCGQRVSGHAPDVITSESNRLFVRLYSTTGGFSGRGFNATYRVRPMRCGGLFTGVRGSISSPNYPNNYDNGLDCEWLIEVNAGHKVELRFDDFALERQSYATDCWHDYVQIFSGNVRDDSQQIARLCGHDATADSVYTSTTHQMLVVMRTDYSETLKGFQAQFSTTCGTTIELTADQPDGTITSDMMYRHAHTLNCNWTLLAANPDERIQLTFLEVHNNPPNCRLGNCTCGTGLEFRQLVEVGSDVVRYRSPGRMCEGQEHRAPYISDGRSIELRAFRKPHLTSADYRFRLQYALLSTACGQHLHSKHGVIATPEYPETYALGTECVWTIAASRGQRLQLTINELDVAESEHCNEAYVEVRETDAQGKLLGTFCGSQAPPTLRAPSFWIKFHAGSAAVGKGFLAAYSHAPLVELASEIGELQSPLYPRYDIMITDPPTNRYRILVPLGSLIAVRVHELVARGSAALTLYDGYDDQSTVLRTFTSAGLAQANDASGDVPVRSSTNVMFVEWRNEGEALFRLTWSAHTSAELAANASAQHQQTLNCTTNSLVRIGVRETVNLTSPGFPSGYDANADCRWTLAPAQDGYHVALYFRAVDLEDSVNCASDSVSARPGAQIAGPFDQDAGALFCTAQSNGSIHAKIHGTPYLQLAFKSDYYGNRTGFAAVAGVACGGTLSGPSGHIDKNMTLTDMFGTECVWHVRVRRGRTIRLRWVSLQLRRDPQTSACDSSVMLRNGPDAVHSPYLGAGQYCGTELPPEGDGSRVLQTTSNEAVVHFTKGASNVMNHFRLDYEEVSNQCGGTVVLSVDLGSNGTVPETFVQTPNYPNIPHAYTECEWQVVGPPGQVLRIDFVGSFELAAPAGVQQPCEQELVELRDGASPGAPLIGTYCDRKPSTLHTTANVLRMRYMTQAKLPKNGFRARVTVDRCGGSFREPSGFIVASPDDTVGGKRPRVCDYRIHQRPGTTLNITLLDLNVGAPWHLSSSEYDETANCSQRNHVAVYGLPPADAADTANYAVTDNVGPDVTQLLQLGIYCDDEEPDELSIITQQPDVLVRSVMFTVPARSQSALAHPRFRLFYNTSMQRCGGDINAASGTILSPGYPVGRPSRQYCEWRITVPAGRRVRVAIVDLDMPAAPPIPLLATPAIGIGGGAAGVQPYRVFYQRLNFYNGHTHGSRIVSLSGSEETRIIESTDNRMLFNMMSRSNAGHRGFRLQFSSDEPSLCRGELPNTIDSDAGASGQLQAPENRTQFECLYRRRNVSAPFFGGGGTTDASANNSGTLALDIRTIESLPGRVPCLRSGFAHQFSVQYAGTRELFAVPRGCTNGTEQRIAQPVLSPFRDTAVAVRQSAWLRSYTVDWRVYACGAAALPVAANGTTIEQPRADGTFNVAGQPVRCAWQLVAGGGGGVGSGDSDRPNGAKLLVSMRFAELDCEHEHVSIYNGATTAAPLVERVCGVAAGERNFTTDITHQRVWVEFHTSRFRPNATRFSVTVQPDWAMCGGRLIAPNFRFRSPRQADLNGAGGGAAAAAAAAASTQLLYPNNMQCEWELRARRGYHVELRFRNRFFVEESANCTRDVVRIEDDAEIDGGNDASESPPTQRRQLAALCGRTVPSEAIRSAGRTMFVSMQTDAQTAGDGFEAEWSEGCGGVYQLQPGDAPQDIYSPNYPLHYDRKANCNYTLYGPPDQYINVEFLEFRLEESSLRGCVYDNLTVYRTPDWTQGRATELVGTYCSEGSLRRLRFKNSIALIFRSDQYLQDTGFHFRYSLDQCGGEVRASGMIRLPAAGGADARAAAAEPDAYLPDLNCVWNITAPDDHKIVVRFERLELEGSDQCYQDYVEVFEGALAEPEKRRAQLCGNLTAHAPVVNVPGQRAVIRFRSDASNQLGGMSALVQFVKRCDLEFPLTEQVPERELSKVFAGGYLANLDCHYRATAPEGWAIELEFKQFHVAPCAAQVLANGTLGSQACACDFVEVRDGGGEFAEPIGDRRCGHETPATVRSTHGAMWVRFVTDSQIASTGMQAVFRLRRTECGPTQLVLNETNSQHTLTWPSSMIGQSLPNQRCTWQFSVPYGSQMLVSFDSLDIPESAADAERPCANNYLEVFEDGNRVYLPEGLHNGTIFTGGRQSLIAPNFYTHQHYASAPHFYCGRKRPDDLITDEQRLTVRFRSDATAQRSAFALTVRAMDACQRNYTSLSGRIASNRLRTCDTHIEVPPNYTIALYFTKFALYPNDHLLACTEANAPVKILDDGRLARFDCASSLPSPYFSNSSRVVLRFHDIGVMQFGLLYDITYVASSAGRGCGGSIYNYGGQISSPLYPAGERQHLECVWQLAVPANQVLAVQFAVFDMGAKSTCHDNYVELIEPPASGDETTEVSMVAKTKRFCGGDTPATMVTGSDRLQVRYKQTVNFSGTGWLLNFMGTMPGVVPPAW